jgi:hypothetical protein
MQFVAYRRMLGKDGQLIAKSFAHGRNARCGKIIPLISYGSANPMPPTSAQADTARVRALAAYKDFLTLRKEADPTSAS